jgi:hypothetical protein
MNTLQSAFFVVQMGIISTLLFQLSSPTLDGPRSYFTHNGTYEQYFDMMIAFAFLYFVVDFMVMVYNNEPTKLYYVHHVIGLVGTILARFYCYQLIKFYIAYMIFELSTPFLNMSMDNRKAGINTLFTQAIEYTFFIIFFIVRVLFGTCILYHIIPYLVEMDLCYRFILILPLSMQLINYYWFYRILRILTKKFKPSTDKKKVIKKKDF